MSEDTTPQDGPDNPTNSSRSIFGPATFSFSLATTIVESTGSILGTPTVQPAVTAVNSGGSIFDTPKIPPATTSINTPRSIVSPAAIPPTTSIANSPAANDQTPHPSPATTISPHLNIERTPSPTPSSSSSRSSSPSSPLPNFHAPAVPAIETFSFSNCLYHLGTTLSSKRRAARIGQQKRRGTAICDLDDSGTYDPREEQLARTAKTKTGSGGRSKKSSGSDNKGAVASAVSRDSREKKGKVEEVRSPGLITFRLKSDEGRQYLRSLPAGCSGLRAEEPKEPLGKRKRVKTAHNKRSDDLALENLTIGHPQYRACKSCFLSGDDECTLIEYGNEYPCAACEDAGVDCELINPPEVKRSCEGCKGKRVTCSFKYDGGIGTNACERCAETGEKCIAGPSAGGRRMNDVLGVEDKNKEREGERLERGKGKEMVLKGKEPHKNHQLQTQPATATARQTVSTKKQKPQPRKYVACNECRDLGTRCSLKPEDSGPCTKCRKQSQDCTFTLLSTKTKTKSKSSSAQKSQPLPLSPVCTDEDRTHAIVTDSLSLRDSEWRTTDPTARKRNRRSRNKSQSGIQPTTILTSFSHPIIFNWNPPAQSSPLVTILPCTWHSNPFFGFWGFGPPRAVEVIPYPEHTGAGYEELKNGYGDSGEGEGEERSRMCVRCTWERIRILGCAGHRMEKLSGVDERLWDEGWVKASLGACVKRAKEGVLGRPDRGTLPSLVWDARWCAVCPSFAEWGCEGMLLLLFSFVPSYSFLSPPPCPSIPRLLPQPTEIHTNTTPPECALPLCSSCNSLHNKVLRGLTEPESGGKSLGRVIAIARTKGTDEYPDGVRADATFLREDGELMMRFERGGCELDGDASKDEGKDGGKEKEQLVGLGVDLSGGGVEKKKGRGRRMNEALYGRGNGGGKKADSSSDSDSDSSDSPMPEPEKKWKGKGVERGPAVSNSKSNSTNAASGWMSNIVVDDEELHHHQRGKRGQKGKAWKLEDGGVIVLLSDDDE
ncbi:C6 finger domain protein [Rutstroemia sp. NJR-2017a WRK4]|nr:C6 finger domain protein [Rutstroemia sp. NJR-2017a WRK4]